MNATNQGSAPDAMNAVPHGIIDTLGNAFALLNRRPYLIWLPIVLDLALWTGLRVRVSEPLDGLLARFSAGSGLLSEVAEGIRDTFSQTDVLSLGSMFVPTLLTDLDRGGMPALSTAGTIAISGNSGFLTLLAAGLAGILIGISYLTMIGRLVLDLPAWGVRFARECVGNSVRALGLAAAVIALLVFLFLPFAALGLALSLLGFDPLVVLLVVGIVLTAWATIYFLFSVHSLALGVPGPLRAMRSSYRVVHRDLLPVLGLLLTVLLIRTGTPIALQIFTDSRWSIPFAILVNAYVSTGLIVATMLYYFERSTDVITAQSAPVVPGAAG